MRAKNITIPALLASFLAGAALAYAEDESALPRGERPLPDAAYMELQRKTPGHLQWRQLIAIDTGSFSPSEQTALIAIFDKIEATQTGQALFQAIVQKRDQFTPVAITKQDYSYGSAAFYDSTPHRVIVRDEFFSTEFEEDFRSAQDQYMVHELGHAAELEHLSSYTARQTGTLRTMLDNIVKDGLNERQAREWENRYNQETGRPPVGEYFTPDHFEWYMLTEDIEAFASGSIMQDIMAGHSRDEAVALLWDRIDSYNANFTYRGIDRESIENFLASPAPCYDENDYPETCVPRPLPRPA